MYSQLIFDIGTKTTYIEKRIVSSTNDDTETGCPYVE
jgi:hypothetical protein